MLTVAVKKITTGDIKMPVTVEEAYFLVRTGTWDQAQLEAWVEECFEQALEHSELDEINDAWGTDLGRPGWDPDDTPGMRG